MSRANANRKFHATLNQLGLMDDKRDIIMEFTAGRTDSARALSNQELRELCEGLNVGRAIPPGDKQRKAIISMAHEMNWRKAGKADMPRINGWCNTYGYLKKDLNSYTVAELPKLVTQFKKAYKDHLNALWILHEKRARPSAMP